MASFPETDLPDTFPYTFGLMMQNKDLFDTMHERSESASPFFGITHRALELAAEPALENPLLEKAVTKGAAIFEVISHAIDPGLDVEIDIAQPISLVSARSYLDSIKTPDDFLHGLEEAYNHMRADAPQLTELVHDVAGRYSHDDAVAEQFIAKGAAAIRGMQIYTVRRIPLVTEYLSGSEKSDDRESDAE